MLHHIKLPALVVMRVGPGFDYTP